MVTTPNVRCIRTAINAEPSTIQSLGNVLDASLRRFYGLAGWVMRSSGDEQAYGIEERLGYVM